MSLNNQTDIRYIMYAYDDTVGKAVALWDDLIQLSVKVVWAKPGLVVAIVPDGHTMLDFAVQDGYFGIELQLPSRLTPSGDDLFYREIMTYCLYRDSQKVIDESGQLYHMLYFVTPNEVLSRYIYAFEKTDFGMDADQMIEYLVTYNMTSSATTANGRLRDAPVIRNMDVVNVSTNSSPINRTVDPGAQISDLIRELAETYQLDVGVVNVLSGTNFNLRTYIDDLLGGQLSNDLSDSVIFDIALDNVKHASVSGGTMQERTVAIVGGQGEGSGRTFSIRTGANYSTPDNDREMYVNARTNASDELDSIGDIALVNVQARNAFSTDVEASLGWMPVRDYDVGDVVTTVLGDVTAEQRIVSIELTFDQTQQPKFVLEFEDFVSN